MPDEVSIETSDNTVVEIEGEDSGIVIENTSPIEVIELSEQGPPGRAGDTGPQGPQGTPGSGGDLYFTYEQLTPSAQWDIQHNLNKRPSVSIVDSANTEVVGEIIYLDNNNVRLIFAAAFSGKVYFN